MARHVYRHSQNLSADTSRTLRMPPAMVWISQLARLQRSCLALCLFGGHTHREAAALLGVTPTTAAGLLTSGLTELGRLAASDPAPG
jgi:DNA-directed RNA polymerase specialized sigma24 family protein